MVGNWLGISRHQVGNLKLNDVTTDEWRSAYLDLSSVHKQRISSENLRMAWCLRYRPQIRLCASVLLRCHPMQQYPRSQSRVDRHIMTSTIIIIIIIIICPIAIA